jgi:mRNA interferase RelE/StbE
MNHKYTLQFSRGFKKSLEKLDGTIKNQIKEAIIKLSNDYAICDIVKLSGIQDVYRLRSGSYRILFKKYDTEMLLLLLDVKHRREVYKDL